MIAENKAFKMSLFDIDVLLSISPPRTARSKRAFVLSKGLLLGDRNFLDSQFYSFCDFHNTGSFCLEIMHQTNLQPQNPVMDHCGCFIFQKLESSFINGGKWYD